MKKWRYALYSRFKHGQTFFVALLLGLLLGKIIPFFWFILPIAMICIFGVLSSLLHHSRRKAL